MILSSHHSAAASVIPGTKIPLTRGLFAGLLLAGGCINGLVAQAEGNWRIEGAGTILQFFGFGFFVPFSIYVGVRLVALAGNDLPKRALGMAALLFSLIVLAPSSLVAWAATFIFAGWIAFNTHGRARSGALIFMGLALVVIWTSVLIKAVMDRVTSLDAWIVQHILALLDIHLERDGNLLISSTGHNIVILMDCATLKRLPLGLLSCVSASLLTGYVVPRNRLFVALGAVGASLVAMNAVRLSLLSLSPHLYELVHGDIGKSIYDAIETLFVIYAGLYLGETRGKPVHEGGARQAWASP